MTVPEPVVFSISAKKGDGVGYEEPTVFLVIPSFRVEGMGVCIG